MSVVWPAVGQVDPLAASVGAVFCPARSGAWSDDTLTEYLECQRAVDHPMPHVHSRYPKRTPGGPDEPGTVPLVTAVWVTLNGDRALSPILDAITRTVTDPTEAAACVEAVVVALDTAFRRPR